MDQQTKGDAVMTISETARASNLTSQALHYQIRIGKLKPLMRTGARGDHLFSTAEVRRFLLARAERKAQIAAKKKRSKKKRVSKN